MSYKLSNCIKILWYLKIPKKTKIIRYKSTQSTACNLISSDEIWISKARKISVTSRGSIRGVCGRRCKCNADRDGATETRDDCNGASWGISIGRTVLIRASCCSEVASSSSYKSRGRAGTARARPYPPARDENRSVVRYANAISCSSPSVQATRASQSWLQALSKSSTSRLITPSAPTSLFLSLLLSYSCSNIVAVGSVSTRVQIFFSLFLQRQARWKHLLRYRSPTRGQLQGLFTRARPSRMIPKYWSKLLILPVMHEYVFGLCSRGINLFRFPREHAHSSANVTQIITPNGKSCSTYPVWPLMKPCTLCIFLQIRH